MAQKVKVVAKRKEKWIMEQKYFFLRPSKLHSALCTLSKLNEYDPVGESGCQEGGEEASIHGEKPASCDTSSIY